MSFFHQLLSNPAAKKQYLLKLRIISLIREFFSNRNYLEIEAPILNDALIPESYLDIFSTQERRIGLDGKIATEKYLMTSPEAFQKKLLSVGFGSNFAITRSFRNGEPLSGKHLSEFSMLEWYEKGSNYLNVMDTTQQLFTFIAEQLQGENKLNIHYNNTSVDLAPEWARLSVNNLFKQILSIDLEDSWDQKKRVFSVKLLQKLVESKELPITFEKSTTWEEIYNQLFLTYIEPNLPTEKPVIIYDYPHELSPLAKPKSGDKVDGNVWAERFEVMVAGLELCDTYSENTDPKLQREAFNREIKKIKANTTATQYKFDWEFVEALEQGLPTCSGNALGIDRVVMMFGDFDEVLVS
jgi:lysyl-tRNA synthetase class 2